LDYFATEEVSTIKSGYANGGGSIHEYYVVSSRYRHCPLSSG